MTNPGQGRGGLPIWVLALLTIAIIFNFITTCRGHS